jgi:hypothetical protein
MYTAELALSGPHDLVVEYYEHGAEALVEFRWDRISSPLYPNWKGEYWSNQNLLGNPIVVRNEVNLDFNLHSALCGKGYNPAMAARRLNDQPEPPSGLSRCLGMEPLGYDWPQSASPSG